MYDDYPHDERDRLIRDWKAKQDAKKRADKDELEARNRLAQYVYGEQMDKKGSETVPLGNGFRIQFKFGQNVTVANDPVLIQRITDKLKRSGSLQDMLVAETLFGSKVTVSAAVYETLSDSGKRIVNEVITTKPAQVAVEFLEPGPIR